MNVRSLFFSISILLFCPSAVSAHGMMCTPRQRGAYSSVDKCGTSVSVDTAGSEVDYCPHCLNGGAVATTSQNLPTSGWAIYDPVKDPANSLGRASLCGDAVGVNDHMVGGRYVPSSVPAVRTYVSGSTVDFSAELDTNHNGYFEFYLCNLDACGVDDIHSKCFTEGHCVKLMRARVDACENSKSDPKMHYECGPIDEKYPGRWYVPCRKTGHVGMHIVGGDNGYMKYQLPKDFHCEKCVVHWYWATANSCAPRGLVDFMERLGNPFGEQCNGDGGSVGTYRKGMAECSATTIPEEFWSCADVRITASDGSSGSNSSSNSAPTIPTPGPTNTPTPSMSMVMATPTPQTNTDTGTASDPQPSTSPSTSPWPSMSQLPEQNSDSNAGKNGEDNGTCVEHNQECNENTLCCQWNQACAYRKSQNKFLCSSWIDMQTEFHRYWTPPPRQ